MCGFVGLLKRNEAVGNMAAISAMLATIAHRGPDDEGLYDGGAVAFGFRRLSILDLSPAGHQPMISPDGQVVIVFNGEIYNFLELRTELARLGHIFSSHSDTEVLLHAYLEWGSECVNRLNGMWAFVIHDRRRRKLFGSRDRFGMKPLYFYTRPDAVLFASEIKAIRASGLYGGGMDRTVCAAYLLEGRLDDTNRTFFEDIRQLPAAHAFELDEDGRFRQWKYWSISEGSSTCNDPAEAFATLFDDSIKLHMRSDVPVGVHLSGGLDSTSILCAAQRLREAEASEPLMAFCFQDPEFDESSYIEATLKQTGARMVRLNTSATLLWADLPHMLAVQDEPVHSLTPVVGYQLMKLAAAHGCTVILNGQGADETLAGYPSYFRDYWSSLALQGGLGAAWRDISKHAALHGSDRKRHFLLLLQHLMQGWIHDHFQTYRSLAAWRQRKRLRDSSWVHPGLFRALDDAPVKISSIGLDAALRRSIELDPLPIYVRVEDRNSMAHSVEARLPFLDYRLVEFAFSLEPDWKLRGPWNKFVLREAMYGRIPEVVRRRPDKLGFPIPVARWIRKELHAAFREIITDAAGGTDEWLNGPVLLEQLEQHRRGEIDASAVLFKAAQFHLWRRTVVEGKHADRLPQPVNGSLMHEAAQASLARV